MNEDIWKEKAETFLRSIIVRKKVKYHELALKLQAMGVQETQGSIANKISRGAFSFAFFLQCMEVLNVKEIRLD